MNRTWWSRIVAWTVLVVLAATLTGCTSDKSTGPGNELAKYNADVPTEWVELILSIIADEKINPPVASRTLGYEGVALYESVVPGLGTHQSLAGQLNGLADLPQAEDADYHWPTVANSALATISRAMFASAKVANRQAIDALEVQFENQFLPTIGQVVFDRSVAYGHAVGQSIAGWAAGDGFLTNTVNCVFTPPTDSGKWEPTPPAFAAPLLPCWGQMRLFVLENADACQPVAPPIYNETPGSQFYTEMMEVYDTAQALTIEQKAIANFWADGGGTITPPGHSFAIATQIIKSDFNTLDVAVEAYARLGIAVADGFISCWKTKFVHNLLRPVTCIRKLVPGAAAWNSYIPTPPFPEYTSGHSVQSGASATVMTDLFGEMSFTDHSHDARDLTPRSFDSFMDAAEEAAISRLYGGIHFRAAIDRGVEQGICIGEKVNALQWKRP